MSEVRMCPFGHTTIVRTNPFYDARQAIHLTLTLIMLWLGFILVLPESTFTSSNSYRAMALVATEEHWATAFLGVGAYGIVGLFVTGPIRKFSVMSLATAHGTLAICLYMGNPSGTGPGTYAIIACLGYYLLYMRLFHR